VEDANEKMSSTSRTCEKIWPYQFAGSERAFSSTDNTYIVNNEAAYLQRQQIFQFFYMKTIFFQNKIYGKCVYICICEYSPIKKLQYNSCFL